MLRGRVPGLQKEIIDVGLVNRTDRRIRIRIRGEQRALGLGKNLPRLQQKTDSVHLRHPLVGQQQRHAIVAQPELIQ